jgi:hypothetical protein
MSGRRATAARTAITTKKKDYSYIKPARTARRTRTARMNRISRNYIESKKG